MTALIILLVIIAMGAELRTHLLMLKLFGLIAIVVFGYGFLVYLMFP